MQTFELKLGDRIVKCEAINVIEGMELTGRVSHVLADGLKSAIDKDISDIFKGDIAPKGVIPNPDEEETEDNSDDAMFFAKMITELVVSSVNFRLGIDWTQFSSLVVDCCEKCTMVSTNKENGKTFSESLRANDLNFRENEQYKIFGWYLECQLGNFIGWKQVKKFLAEKARDFQKTEKQS